MRGMAVRIGLSGGSVVQVKPCQFDTAPAVVNVAADAPAVGEATDDASALGTELGGVVALG